MPYLAYRHPGALLAPLKQSLHPQADAKERAVGLQVGTERGREATGVEDLGGGGGGRASTGREADK